MKKNYLFEKMNDVFKGQKKGSVLDLGCGEGEYSRLLNELGFEVTAADLDEASFRYAEKIKFRKCNVTETLPFADSSFDYVLLFEVIEHLKDPYSAIEQIRRILKKDGILFISTPNILNIKSRFRFLMEGAYEFFREPLLEQSQNPKEKIYNLHIHPLRFQEMEYLLASAGFKIEDIFTSLYEGMALSFFIPLIKLQMFLKQSRSKQKKGIDYSRIKKILLSEDLLFGRHLVIKCKKT